MDRSCYGIRQSIFRVVVSLPLMLFATSIFAAGQQAKKLKLACFYYDRNEPHRGVGFSQPGLSFVWAKGEANEVIHVNGTMVDGFFHAATLEGSYRPGYRMMMKTFYDSKLSVAQALCQNGLKDAFPQTYQNLVMIHQGAKKHRLSIRGIPIAYAENDSGQVKNIDKMVVFGDSLSDQGNLKNYLRLFPKAPYFAGRFSNGEIWVDYLQRTTGIAVLNYAYSGSVADPAPRANLVDKDLGERMMARVQIKMSGSVRREINRFIRKSLNGNTLSSPDTTLFSLWIGANDYVKAIETHGAVDIFLDNPEHPALGYHAVVYRVTDHIISYVEQLYTHGARNIFVGNIPDLGKAPRMLTNRSYHRNHNETLEQRVLSLSHGVTEVVAYHNQLLLQKIESLKQAHPDLNLMYGDSASAEGRISSSRHLMDHSTPFNYDLSPNTRHISHEGRSVHINHPCYLGGAMRSRPEDICQEPHKTTSWDDLHPTTYGHCLIAAYIHTKSSEQGLFGPITLNDYLKLCRPDLVH